jgi:hypothetical protein
VGTPVWTPTPTVSPTEAANSWANLASVQRELGHAEQARDVRAYLSLFEQKGAKSKVLRVRRLLSSLDQLRSSQLPQLLGDPR